MPTTMETWAKLTGGYGVLKGGIKGANEQLKKLGPEAKMERIQKKEQKKQDKKDAKIKKEAADEYVREHKDIKKRLRKGALTTQEAQEAYKKAIEKHTAKISGTSGSSTKAGSPSKISKTEPNVAGQDISGIDSVAIVSAIENQTVEIITELGTDSPKDAGSPKLESDAKFTPDSPEDTLLGQAVMNAPIDGVPESSPENTLLGQVESIWGYAKAFTVGTGSEAKPDAVKVDAGSSLWALEEAITQDQILDQGRDVAKHLIETNVLLLPMKSALAELVDMGRDSLAFDARRENREIKEDGRALEDRRDANKKFLDKKGSSGSSGSPTLNKEGEEGGLTQNEGIATGITAYLMGKAGGLTNMIKKGFKFAFKPVAMLGTALGIGAATPTPTSGFTPSGMPIGPSSSAAGAGRWARGASTVARGTMSGVKYLAPIDIAGKMNQGQTLFEATTNMLYELGQMGVGGVDWVSEKVTGGKGLLDAQASDYILKPGDVFGNEKKWDTHWMERGINTTMAAWTGTEREADKKEWTEEDKKLAFAAQYEHGAVELGTGWGGILWGQAYIKRLEALTLLDPKSLEALLAYQVWSDKDQKLIEDIRDAKLEGRSVKYNDNGIFGFERVDFGETPTENASRLNRGLGDNVSGRRDIRGGPGDEDTTALWKKEFKYGNMGTLYFNKAQIEKYKALELATKATIQEAEQIKEAAKAQLKKEGLPRDEMLAREKKIEEDAKKMIQKSKDAEFFHRVQMKRDTETQDKLKKNWIDKTTKKTETTESPTVNGVPPTVADEDSILEAVANKKEAKIKKIRLLVAGPGNAADPTVADEDSAVTTNGVPPTGDHGSVKAGNVATVFGNKVQQAFDGSVFTNAQGYGKYLMSIKGKEVELDAKNKANWSDEEIEAYLNKLYLEHTRYMEQSEAIANAAGSWYPESMKRERREKSIAFSIEEEELEQLQKSRTGPGEVGSAESPTVQSVGAGWNVSGGGVLTGVEMGDQQQKSTEEQKTIFPLDIENPIAYMKRQEARHQLGDSLNEEEKEKYWDYIRAQPDVGLRTKPEEINRSDPYAQRAHYDAYAMVKGYEKGSVTGHQTDMKTGNLISVQRKEGSDIIDQALFDKTNKMRIELGQEPLPVGLSPAERQLEAEGQSLVDSISTESGGMIKPAKGENWRITKHSPKLTPFVEGSPDNATMSDDDLALLSGTGTPLDAEEFGKGLPDPEKQDEVAIKMLSPGSIYVHDMKAESAIKNLMLTPIETTAPPVEANFDQIPATMLEQAIVTATMQAATTNQAVAQSGGSRMVNAPTTIDNSSHQILTPPSTAHGPAVPPGSGIWSILTPRG